MKFSVLMSVYVKDDPIFLRQAIDSIFFQEVVPNEYIIVEDGPLTEELYDVLDSAEAGGKKNGINVKRYPLTTNAGLGNALRHGVSKCGNEWIARMDSDDVSTPDRFTHQVNYIEKHPEVDVVGTNIDEYDDELTVKVSSRLVPKTHDEIMGRLKQRSPFNHVTVMYRKSAVERAGNYEDCPYFEDYYLWCRLAAVGAKFHNIQRPLLRVRAGNAIAQRRGGLSYVRNIIEFEKRIWALKIITLPELITNCFTRSVVALSPSLLRVVFYQKVLRDKGEG